MPRKMLSENDLLRVLNDEISTKDECAGCKFTSVVRLKDADETGCNWSHANLRCSGRPADVCCAVADRVISSTKDKYNIG